ncbi:MAG: HAMP domain-containing histidine kinase, partial [Chloroflexi bacterium]|nr:HAMP domain-containing histidine kinase [Chloroflexota bacterium]
MHEYNFSVAHDPAKFLTEVMDLRVEIMNKGVMVLVGVVSWLSMPMTSFSGAAGNRSSSLIALAAFVLIFACAVLSWQGHPKPALLLCAWGTLTLSLLLSVTSPGYSASLYVVGACVIVALLAGAWHGWAAVLLYGCVVALRMALAPGDQPTMDLAVVTIVGAAMLVYLTQVVIRVLFQTLRWMSEGYEVISRQSDELRDKGAELAGALKSLGQTSFALAHANEQLQVVVKYAEEARSSKQAFAASVSHELRAPLNLIIGFSDVILNAPSTYRADQLPQGLLADVHIIYNNAQHLLKLVDDILDLSQLDMNYLTIIQERVRIDELIKTTLNDVAELATARGLGLTAEVAPELPEILADRTRIRQVLLNLISNAVRFTDSGGIIVRAAMSQDTEVPGREGAIDAFMLPVPARPGSAPALPLSHIIVSVSDTGVGIAPEDLQRIFEPFSQAGAPARKRGGAGLGLTISKQFIELHGGRMWVESRQGAGSTFYFTLPVQPPSPMSNIAASSLSGQRREVSALVVVEPSPLLTRILQRHLSGIPVVHAFHAAEAAACLQAGNAEAVLINTPLEAGVDVASLMLPPYGLETVPVLRCYVP